MWRSGGSVFQAEGTASAKALTFRWTSGGGLTQAAVGWSRGSQGEILQDEVRKVRDVTVLQAIVQTLSFAQRAVGEPFTVLWRCTIFSLWFLFL